MHHLDFIQTAEYLSTYPHSSNLAYYDLLTEDCWFLYLDTYEGDKYQLKDLSIEEQILYLLFLHWSETL